MVMVIVMVMERVDFGALVGVHKYEIVIVLDGQIFFEKKKIIKLV